MKKYYHFIFIVFLSSLLFNNISLSQWTKTNGPEGGTILTILSGQGIWYVGTSTSGVYKSTNFAIDPWISSSSGLNRQRIQALSFSSDSIRIFAGTDSGMYISTNNGIQWNPINSGLSNLNIRAIASSGSSAYAGTTTGVFKTSNFGVSWQPVNLGVSNLNISSIAISGTMVFAGTNKGMFRSTNGGTNWIIKNSGFGIDSIINVISIYGNFIYTGNNRKVFRDSLTGNSWSVFGTGLESKKIISISILTPNVIYAATNDSVYTKNISGSPNWVRINNASVPGRNINVINAFSSIYLLVGQDVAGFMIKYGAVLISNNKGLAALRTTSLVNICSDLYAGTIKGAYKTLNQGLNWTSINSGLDSSKSIAGIASLNNNLFITNGSVYKSTNYGSNWIYSGIDGIQEITNLLTLGTRVFISNSVKVSVQQNKNYLSTNMGSNWQIVNSGISTNAQLGAYTSTGTKLFCIASLGFFQGVYKSTNFGTNWVLTDTGNISDKNISCISSNNSILYLGTYSNGIYKSADYGGQWEQVNSGLTNLNINTISSFNNNVYCGTTQGGIFLSTNSGINWNKIDTGLIKIGINTFSFDETYIYAATDASVWKRPISQFLTADNSVNKNFTSTLFQNYPNPFNPNTIITYGISERTKVRIKIYDILGKEVRTLVNENQNAGTYSVKFETTDLSAGIYFYELQTDNFIKTKRMLLLK